MTSHATVKVSGVQYVKAAMEKAIKEFKTDEFVTIGIHEDAGEHKGGISNAALGALLHFGGDINHPGGTGFGSKSTGPHVIKIPPRPWLDVGVATGEREYAKIIKESAAKGKNLSFALEKVGVVAAGKVKEYMIELKTPPNAPSTIRKKGVDNPLIETGQLMQSVTSEVTTEKPTEGI